MKRAAALSCLTLAACPPGTPPAPDKPSSPDAPTAPMVDAMPSDVLGPPWNLIWRDEFDGAENTRPDPTKWRHDVGGEGWGNAQLEFDTDRVENASHDGQGRLRIVARRENYGGRQYTSARLNTAGKFERAYGRFEARIKLPRGQGIWPAFWVLGANISNVSWPTCGEIDIMENRGQQIRHNRGSLHGPGYSAGGNVGKDIDTGIDLSQAFHTYAIEWDPGRVVFKFDEEAFFTATPADLPMGTQWVYDHPFFIILNVAVGGNFVGAPDGSTQFPQTMLVDHVRVYERIK
jgi:beta-glucanase (GH16 family)